MPTSRTRRRPIRSATVPAAKGRAANVTLNVLSVHWASATEACRLLDSWGRATATPVTENGSRVLASPMAATVNQ